MTHESNKIPHFFIVGAQKAGTTSLCALLDALDGVCLSAPKEPMILSRDDALMHPHFFAEQPEAWQSLDWDVQREAFLAAYNACFAHAKPGDLLGDGSTSYLHAAAVPARIRAIRRDAKIIAVLRDPAQRAYSAYWHYVKTGHATESFARHLQYEGGLTLASGEYVSAIARWKAHFPDSHLLFVCYEALLANPQAEVARICAHLGITPADTAELPRENTAKTPRILMLQLAINWLYRRLGRAHSAIVHPDGASRHWLDVALSPLQNWNLCDAPYPQMPKPLHQQLDRYYARVNAELESLTGLDVSPYWYRTRNTPQ